MSRYARDRYQSEVSCPEEYVNSKEYQSIVLQGLANTKNLFRNIFVRWFWQSNDAIVFRKFPINQECLDGSFCLRQYRLIEMAKRLLIFDN